MRNIRTFVVMTTALLLGSPVLAAESTSVTGIKTTAGLFAGAMEFLGIRSDAMAHVSQTRPELSPVAQYQINRANNQNADFVK
jgi:hypothetical protein